MRRTVACIVRAACVGSLVLMGLSAAAAPSEGTTTAIDVASPALRWSLRAPLNQPVPYQGAVNFDGAGAGTTGMLYPAPNLVGMVAAVLTHALVLNTVQSQEKERLQTAADAVLTPYRGVLDNYTLPALASDAFVRTRTPGRAGFDVVSPAQVDQLVEVSPRFWMTQDQRALLMESVVKVSDASGDPSVARSMVVRVVSDPWAPAGAQDVREQWGSEDGARLKEQSAILLALAVDVALDKPHGVVDATPFKTFRYVEGSTDRIERGQLVHQQCGRVVFKTLRGALMSAPVSTAAASAEKTACESLSVPR